MKTDYFKGKTVDYIDESEGDEFLLIHFTDKTTWLIVAERWNCSSAHLLHKISFGHRLNKVCVAEEKNQLQDSVAEPGVD